MRAFDCDKADIVVEVRPRGEREHFLQDRGEELIRRELCMALERGRKRLLAEFLSLGRDKLQRFRL